MKFPIISSRRCFLTAGSCPEAQATPMELLKTPKLFPEDLDDLFQ
jgi:hypothetical protein